MGKRGGEKELKQVHFKGRTPAGRDTKITVEGLPWSRGIEIYWDLEKQGVVRIETSDTEKVRIIIEDTR